MQSVPKPLINRDVYRDNFLAIHVVLKKKGPNLDVVEKGNAVAFLIYDPTNQVVILTSQQREPMRTPKNPKGFILEIPAGHLENMDIKSEIAREAYEEVGIKIGTDQIKLLNRSKLLASSPGWTTEKVAFGYVELLPGQLKKTGKKFGLANEGEIIKRRIIKISKLRRMVFEDLKTFAFVQWFLRKIENKKQRRVR